MQPDIFSAKYFLDPSVVAVARQDHLAELATQALIAEAELTPKPGLVDRRGSGAHSDLSLDLLCSSAMALKPYFAAMAHCSVARPIDSSLREELALIGRNAERAMYEATGGSNAHKGSIWILGLLIGAAARGNGQNATEIAAAGGAIACLPDRAHRADLTHGGIAKIRYGVGGARGEACGNFPHITKFGLPVLRRQRAAGFSEQVSCLDALFSIMAHLEDTCVLYRGGMEALHVVNSGARAVLAAGGSSSECGRNQMRRLDDELIAMHVSPGGSADLLAATIFLDAVERRQEQICADRSEWLDENHFVSKFKEDELEVTHGAA
jgi:triphosphoribosyl-dephospho-CoA synthase